MVNSDQKKVIIMVAFFWFIVVGNKTILNRFSRLKGW